MKNLKKTLNSLQKISDKLTDKLLANTKIETQIRLAKVILPNYYYKNYSSSRR